MSNEGSNSGLEKPGKIVIISSPSGGGKTTICKKLLELHKNDGWSFSISATTRPKRANEVEGREYYFVQSTEFARMKLRNEFAESCVVHGFRYGTPRWPIEKTLKAGGVLLLDVDYKGAFKLKRQYPMAGFIFILPPSRRELETRLRNRATENESQIKKRLFQSLREMNWYSKFDNVVINDDLNQSVREIDSIVFALHTRNRNLDKERIKDIIGYKSRAS